MPGYLGFPGFFRMDVFNSLNFLIFLLLLGVSGHAFGVNTFLHVDATASSYIGDGNDHTVDGISVVTGAYLGNPNSLGITGGQWSIVVSAQDEDLLVPENYEFAVKRLTHSFPHMDISWASLGCNYSEGRFVIHEIELNGSSVLRLAMDFEFTCYDLIPERLVGQVRLNSDIGKVPDGPNAAAGRDVIVDEGWNVYLDGSLSGQGLAEINKYSWKQLSGPAIQILDPDSKSTEFVAPVVDPGGADVLVELMITDVAGRSDADVINIKVQDVTDPHTYFYTHENDEYYPNGKEYYFPENSGIFKFVTGFGVTFETLSTLDVDFFPALEKGYFVDAEKSPYEIKDRPRLSYDTSCVGVSNISPGRFFVHEIGYDANNNIDKLAIDFIDYCHSIHYGAIRYNSSHPLYRSKPYAVAGNDQEVFEGARVVLNGGYSDSGSDIVLGNEDKIISYNWVQIAGDPVQINNPDLSIATFLAPAVTTEDLLLYFRLTVVDAEGLTDSDVVQVKVKSTSTVRTYATARGFSGKNWLFTDGDTNFQFNHVPPSMIDMSANSNDSMNARLRTDDGSAFRQGIFSMLPDDPDVNSKTEVLGIGIAGRGCNQDYGIIDVLEFTKNITHDVTSLAVDYVHYCESGSYYSDIKTTGKIVYNLSDDGDVPISSAGPDVVIYEGDTIFLDATGSYDGDGEILGYFWRQISGQLQSVRYINYFQPGEVPEIKSRQLLTGDDEERLVFVVEVIDDNGFESSDTFSVQVLKSNQEPIAVGDRVTIQPGDVIDIDVKANDYDIDGSLAGFVLGESPKHGQRTVTGDEKIRYTSNVSYVGQDSFTYAVKDNLGKVSNYVTVSIDIVAIDETLVEEEAGGDSNSAASGEPGSGSGSLSYYFIMMLLLSFIMKVFYNAGLVSRCQPASWPRKLDDIVSR